MRTRHCTIPYRSAYGKYSKIVTVRLPEHTYAGIRMYLRSTWGVKPSERACTGHADHLACQQHHADIETYISEKRN